MMKQTYKPRRAGKRWNNDAPDWILDCFDHPQFADRFTVFFGAADSFHVRSDGSIRSGPGSYANTYLTGIGTSETGAVSGSLELSAHDVRMYRYHNGHRRIAWRDLPDATRALVERFHAA